MPFNKEGLYSMDDTKCVRCGQRYGDHQGQKCPDEVKRWSDKDSIYHKFYLKAEKFVGARTPQPLPWTDEPLRMSRGLVLLRKALEEEL
jgi:hypothetical protein